MLTSPTARAAEDQVGGRFRVLVSEPERFCFVAYNQRCLDLKGFDPTRSETSN
jgi:hypothetical protein